MKLESTGERLLAPDGSCGEDCVIGLMHAAAYRWAEPFAHGKRVLDYGCGTGYGAARIAPRATLVDAVDVAGDAVEYGQQRFARNNLRFHRIQRDDPLPFADGTFDVVLSFQVLEHVSERTIICWKHGECSPSADA